VPIRTMAIPRNNLLIRFMRDIGLMSESSYALPRTRSDFRVDA
jgi:hypothetical protein